MKHRRKAYLWVWEGVLTDYTSGVAFSLAPTVEEAVAAVKKAGCDYEGHWEGTKLDGVEPFKVSKTTGFYCWGGG